MRALVGQAVFNLLIVGFLVYNAVIIDARREGSGPGDVGPLADIPHAEGPLMVPQGTSPDYLMSKDGKDVLVFQCVPGGGHVKGINSMTDGTNWMHIYQQPCWAI